MKVRVIALGADFARDDGAALRVADELARDGALEAEVIRAGRPGPALLDHLTLDAPVLLLDVIRAGLQPGELLTLPLAELRSAAVAQGALSSHGFGAAEALRLGEVLGRPLPDGLFVGLEGHRFEPGPDLSPAVERSLPAFVDAARQALHQLDRTQPCTNPA